MIVQVQGGNFLKELHNAYKQALARVVHREAFDGIMLQAEQQKTKLSQW